MSHTAVMLNGLQLGERTLRVSMAKTIMQSDPKERTVYVGNVGLEVDQAMLYALFSNCGVVTGVRLAGDPNYNNRYAFVEFADPMMSHTAVMLNGLQLGERTLRVSMAKTGSGGGGGGMGMSTTGVPRAVQDPDRVQRTIHIASVDPVANEQHLQAYFSVCGEVTAVRVSGDGFSTPRFGWVEFGTAEATTAALALDGQPFGSQNLRITPSKSAIQNNGLLKYQQQQAAYAGMMQPAMMQAPSMPAAAAAVAPPPPPPPPPAPAPAPAAEDAAAAAAAAKDDKPRLARRGSGSESGGGDDGDKVASKADDDDAGSGARKKRDREAAEDPETGNVVDDDDDHDEPKKARTDE
eukprot:CAMPEP_0170162280 /NCGR_PEP_ID=MMETSP0033_2-20121228/77016_1 /TAXON_ID=195969 /ORGANISM="Dolichomastix tenuilepis, Strain CCMP3274" /LENGTH=350 /DNA_ID=CAMNT_0010399903 /DNA_START=598 /DNA_END=1650 /DNA_ORIENTATION=-